MQGPGLWRQGRHELRLEIRQHQNVEHEKRDLGNRRADRTGVHITHRLAELISQHHQNQRWRDDLGDRARSCDHAGGQLHVVAIAHHDRQRNHAHRNHRCRHRAGDRTEHRTHDDDRVSQTAGHRPKELPHAFEQVFGQTAAFENRPHEGEKGDGQQQLVGQNAEDAQRQV